MDYLAWGQAKLALDCIECCAILPSHLNDTIDLSRSQLDRWNIPSQAHPTPTGDTSNVLISIASFGTKPLFGLILCTWLYRLIFSLITNFDRIDVGKQRYEPRVYAVNEIGLNSKSCKTICD